MVCFLTWLKAWKTHLCTFVSGHTLFLAFPNPGPPSVTTTSGGGIGDMSAAHALEFSDLARYQPMTCSSVLAMSTTTFLAMWMPSTKTTRCTSPVGCGIGHTSQNFAHLRLNVLALHGPSACVLEENSQFRNILSSFASLSILCVAVALQDLQSHRCAPAAVLPFRTILPPHTGHLTLFMPRIEARGTFRPLLHGLNWAYSRKHQHVLADCKVGRQELSRAF